MVPLQNFAPGVLADVIRRQPPSPARTSFAWTVAVGPALARSTTATLTGAVLTVRAHEANSHKDRGWETFTDHVIDALNRRAEPIVFALWGNYAQKKGKRIDASRHVVVKGAHPSPLSAKLFLGSKPFSAIDASLVHLGHAPLDWRL